MSPDGIYLMLAMAGCMILAVAAYRSHNLGGARTLKLALLWAAIFVAVTLLFTAMM